MANKVAVQFYCPFSADGTSTTLIVDFSTAPIGYNPPLGAEMVGFQIGNLTLSGFANLACSTGQTVSFTNLLNIVTFTLSSAPTAGTTPYIYGYVTF